MGNYDYHLRLSEIASNIPFDQAQKTSVIGTFIVNFDTDGRMHV